MMYHVSMNNKEEPLYWTIIGSFPSDSVEKFEDVSNILRLFDHRWKVSTKFYFWVTEQEVGWESTGVLQARSERKGIFFGFCGFHLIAINLLVTSMKVPKLTDSE